MLNHFKNCPNRRFLRYFKRRTFYLWIIILSCLYISYCTYFTCSDVEIQVFLTDLKNLYENGNITGNLCQDIWVPERFTNIRCESFHIGKQVVFSALWNSTQVMVKSSRRHPSSLENVYWTDDRGKGHYPNVTSFVSMVNAALWSNFRRQWNLTEHDVRNHFNISNGNVSHAYMNSMYFLVQQTEYLLSWVFRHKNIFPPILGTCGHVYAVGFMEPINTTFHLPFMPVRQLFCSRAKTGVKILEVLETLDMLFLEPVHLCDVKPDHFGVDSSGQVHILDGDTIFVQSAVEENIQTIGKCSHDKDCNFFDCFGSCNQTSRTCMPEVANDNLQRICENVFRGRIFGQYSGLLVGPPDSMSHQLYKVLEECIEVPSKHQEAQRRQIHRRLHSLLNSIIVTHCVR